MKIKTGLLILAIFLQGCVSDFEEKYDSENQIQKHFKDATTQDESKAKPYIKYDRAYIGKKVDYSVEQQRIMGKHVKISSYEPATLAVIMDAVSAQTGISYRIKFWAYVIKRSDILDKRLKGAIKFYATRRIPATAVI